MGAVDVCIIGFTATQYNITFSYNVSILLADRLTCNSIHCVLHTQQLYHINRFSLTPLGCCLHYGPDLSHMSLTKDSATQKCLAVHHGNVGVDTCLSLQGSPTLNQPLQIRIEPGPVSCNDTYVIRLPSVIEAGSNNETVMVQLRDIYSNNIICQVDMLTVKVTSQQSGWSLTLHAVSG